MRVWSIHALRSTILQYIPTKDIVSLLTVSKPHFEGAIRILYEDLEYKNYQKYIESCPDEERKSLYQDAVRTIRARWPDDYPPLSHRILLFSSFPKAIRMVCIVYRDGYPNSLLNQEECIVKEEESRGHRAASYILEKRLSTVSPGDPWFKRYQERPSRLPEGWECRYILLDVTLVDLADFKPTFLKEWPTMEAILTKLPIPDHICESLRINGVPTEKEHLNILASTVKDGYLEARGFRTFDWEYGDLAWIGPMKAFLKRLVLRGRGTHRLATSHNPTDSSIPTIPDFVNEFVPADYPNLQTLYLSIRGDLQAKSPRVMYDNLNELDILQCALPRQGIKDIDINVSYPLVTASQQERAIEEGFLIRRLVRHLIPLVDPYSPPATGFRVHMDAADKQSYDTVKICQSHLGSLFESELARLIAKALEQGKLVGGGEEQKT
ncbi:hypothetical protein IAT40_000267 [Kwoniella sp. CBS 6097]